MTAKKTTLRAALAATVGLALMAGPALAEGELKIYNWGNYTNPALIEKFEQQYNIDVTLDDYDTNEAMMAKVGQGGSGYDIVVPTDWAVQVMIEKGLLEETKPNEMENFRHVDPRWVDVYWDPGRNYTVPWQWGTTSFVVDTAVYDGPLDTLAVLYEPPPELQGRINMLNDINEVLNGGLRYLGLERCNSNPEDLRRLNELLQAAKPHWRTMDYSAIEKLTAGDVDASQTFNGAAQRARAQRPTLVYAYPKEGFTGWMDNVAVLKDAPNKENAKLFQNFIMAPENAALISDFAKYANAIQGSQEFFEDKEMATAPEFNLPADAPEPDFVPPCPQEVTELYDRIWTSLRN